MNKIKIKIKMRIIISLLFFSNILFGQSLIETSDENAKNLLDKVSEMTKSYLNICLLCLWF